MSICLLLPLPSFSNPSRFIRHPDIYSLVWPDPRHHISITPSFRPPFDSRHLHNILSIHPNPPPPSISHSFLFLSIYLYIYLSPFSNFLSPLSHTHSLSLYISLQPVSVPDSNSLYHSLSLNSPLSNYLNLHLSYTQSLTLSDLYRASAPPISVMPTKNLIAALIFS